MGVVSHRKKAWSLNKGLKVTVVGWDMGSGKSTESTLLTLRERCVTAAGFKVNSVPPVSIINNY